MSMYLCAFLFLCIFLHIFVCMYEYGYVCVFVVCVYKFVCIYLCVEGNGGILIGVSPTFSEMILVAGGPQQ